MSLMSTAIRLAHHGREDGDTDCAVCPADGWSFPPRYTDGRCPLCGWIADGWAQPREAALDAWMWRLIGAGVVLSAIVLWLTLTVYGRG